VDLFRLARKQTDAADQNRLLVMAEAWLDLADRIAGRIPKRRATVDHPLVEKVLGPGQPRARLGHRSIQPDSTAERRMARTSNCPRPTVVDSFGPDIVEVLAKAYDMAIAALHGIGQPDVPREVIAKRIIEGAQEGEHDPVVLCAIALGALNPDMLC
jgi:hypothetical protein